jgi:xanthine dehydrogenase molybdenum-binding subunit
MVPGTEYSGTFVSDRTEAVGSEKYPKLHSSFGYSAQVVVIDRKTKRIERIVAAHDVGRAINPAACVGQIQGAVHMGLGYALSENFPCDDRGAPAHMTLRSLGILRAVDVPPIEVHLIEIPQPGVPTGIKGAGEAGLVATAGAVAQALHDLDGRWRSMLPMDI